MLLPQLFLLAEGMSEPPLLEISFCWTPTIHISCQGAAGQPQTLLGDGFPPSWEHVRSCRDILALAKSPWRLLCTLGNSFCRASGCTNCSSQAVSKASFYWEGFSDTWARTSFQVRSLVEAGISLHYEA